MWVIIWLSSSFTFPTAAGVALHAGSAKDPSPVGFVDWLPLPQGCDTLLEVMADRAVLLTSSAVLSVYSKLEFGLICSTREEVLWGLGICFFVDDDIVDC